MHVGFEVIAAGSVLQEGQGGASGYMEGLVPELLRDPRVERLTVYTARWYEPATRSSGIAKFTGEGINALTIDSSGRIYLAGVGATIVRLNRNGSIDTTFGSGGVGFYCDSNKCAANCIALQPSQGDIVLAGATEIDNTYEILALLVFP